MKDTAMAAATETERRRDGYANARRHGDAKSNGIRGNREKVDEENPDTVQQDILCAIEMYIDEDIHCSFLFRAKEC